MPCRSTGIVPVVVIKFSKDEGAPQELENVGLKPQDHYLCYLKPPVQCNLQQAAIFDFEPVDGGSRTPSFVHTKETVWPACINMVPPMQVRRIVFPADTSVLLVNNTTSAGLRTLGGHSIHVITP